jgi:hypothetical protein
MKDERLPELDILRIISILIVVILIHIPNDYAYSYYIESEPYTIFLFHTLGIMFCSFKFCNISVISTIMLYHIQFKIWNISSAFNFRSTTWLY